MLTLNRDFELLQKRPFFFWKYSCWGWLSIFPFFCSFRNGKNVEWLLSFPMSMSHYNLIVMSEQKCRALAFCFVALFSQVAMIYNQEVRKFNFYWLGFARSSNTLLDAVPEASLLQSHAFFSSTGFSSIRSSEAAVASIREAAFPTTAAQQPLQLHIISGGDSQLIRVASSLFSVLTRKIYVHLSPWNRTT